MQKTPTEGERYAGCLLGGAIGDALGAPVEFMTRSAILRRYGPRGIEDFVERKDKAVQGQITDDTQMTLFTAEGLLAGRDVAASVYAAYTRWLRTQYAERPASLNAESGLLRLPEMWRRRAPGTTCVGGLLRARDLNRFGTVDAPLNDSDTCGGVMRVAPVGLFFTDPTAAFDAGVQTAAITHGGANAYLSAGYFAALISLLASGTDLDAALDAASNITKSYAPAQSVDLLKSIAVARRLVQDPSVFLTDSEAYDLIGEGWDGISAVALAIFAAVRHEDDFEAALRCAVNHSGDSDTTGSLTGQILGTLHGVKSLPKHWRNHIELKDEIAQMANALLHYRQ